MMDRTLKENPRKQKDDWEFKVSYCETCEVDTIVCPKCGNNCCNGSYGVIDGEWCDVCPLAHQYWGRLLDIEMLRKEKNEKDE